MKISGNTVLITGGTSGIGFEMAKQLLARDNKVIITGRDQAKLDQAKQKLNGVAAFRCDVSLISEIKALQSKIQHDFPELNILINNAGIMCACWVAATEFLRRQYAAIAAGEDALP